MLKYLIIVLLLAGCTQSPVTPRDILLGAKDGSVRILTEDGKPNGSGFITTTPAGRLVVITNDHVCDGLKTHQLLLHSLADLGLRAFKSDPILFDQEKDLCAFPLHPAFRLVTKALRISSSPLSQYDRVFIVGYPAMRELSVQEGLVLAEVEEEVAGIDTGRCQGRREPSFFGMICIQMQTLIQTSTPTIGGNSGSPALNEEGEVIGVYNSGDTMTSYGNYIKLEALKEFLGAVDQNG